MARENERNCIETAAKTQSDRSQDAEKTLSDCKPNGLRVRFLDEEGKTERTVSADEVDCSVTRVKKVHILKNRSSSETSILLRNPSLLKRRSSEHRLVDCHTDNLNNNNNNNTASSENLNGKVEPSDADGGEQTKESNGLFKKNCNVYSVHQAKTLTPERKKSIPLMMPRLLAHKPAEGKSILPAEVCLAEGLSGKDFTARAIGRLSRGIGKLLRRSNSVRISEPDPVYKVAYLGNVLTGWARGENCIEKPLATLWRNYQQSTKPDVVMKLSVTNSGLKGFTKEHGLTEYWSHRITYCASPPHYPKLFCWVYRHEGKKLKHELRCHAVLCTKESISKKITEELQVKLKQALVEFKKERISKQNARLSLANSVYDNPSMPRRKILLSVGSMNYRPPLERSKSAPKLGAIEELCSEEDEEEAEMNARANLCNEWTRSSFSNDMDNMSIQTLDRRRPDVKSPRKMSCPEGIMNRLLASPGSETVTLTDELLDLISKESNKDVGTSHDDDKLEAIVETNEIIDTAAANVTECKLSSNFLVTDSDDGSVSSGCETASTAASDSEPTSLPSLPQEDKVAEETGDRIGNYSNEVNHVPIGEKNGFRRRSTYPPLSASILSNFEENFESLIDNLTDADSLTSSTETEVFKSVGDSDSACSDESGYSEFLDGKESIIGNTIMV